MVSTCLIDNRSFLASDLEVVEGNPFDDLGRKITKPSITVTLQHPEIDVDRFLLSKRTFEIRVSTGAGFRYGREMYLELAPVPDGNPGSGAFRAKFLTDYATLQ